MPPKTYSSVKEALEQSGIMERIRRDSDRNSNRRSSSSSLSQSFTVPTQQAPRLHTPDTRSSFVSSTLSDVEESSSFLHVIAVEQIALSSDTPPPEEINLGEMTQEDLQRLKQEDPFLYYSIPEVHNRSYHFEDNDDLIAAADAVRNEANRREDDAAAPSEDGTYQDEGGARCPAAEAAAAVAAVSIDDRPAGNATPSACSRISSHPRPRYRPGLTERTKSCPAGMLAHAEIARATYHQKHQSSSTAQNVIKRRRLSVEAHPNLICEDLLGRIITETDGVGADRLDEEDRLLRMLLMDPEEQDGEEKDDDEEEEGKQSEP